ncbi:MAG: hypothetical protein R2799_00550 [Crocinitomicaceae bacterium]
MDSIGKYKVPSIDDIRRDLIELQSKLNKIEGISGVKCHGDFDYFLFKINGSFRNVDALNKVYTEVYNFKRKDRVPLIEAYKYDGKTYVRTEREAKSNIFLKNAFLNENQFTEGKIMIVARFASEVVEASNHRTVISKNKKAILTKCSAADLMKQPSIINCEAKIK